MGRVWTCIIITGQALFIRVQFYALCIVTQHLINHQGVRMAHTATEIFTMSLDDQFRIMENGLLYWKDGDVSEHI